jgi:DNA mismatch repair protein MLH3
MESSFAMNTTGSTKIGKSQTSIDLTEYTKKHDGATVIHSVCVSAVKVVPCCTDPHRILPLDQEQDVLWIDPRTHRPYKVDLRTGTSTRFSTDSLPVPAACRVSLRSRNWKKGSDHLDTPEWIQQAMEVRVERNKLSHACSRTQQGIDASVFTAGRKPDVWSIDSVAPAPGPSVTQPDSSTETRRQQERRALKSQTHTTRRFSKEELGNARIIGQVDCKFVACTLPGDSTDEGEPVLVLIDQHAADERVRVEDS